MGKSCVGCKFLYVRDEGYSNYTVIDSAVDCAKDLNAELPDSMPWKWRQKPDNWRNTMHGRCSWYSEGPQVHLDVERECYVEDQTEDAEVRVAIIKHSGIRPKPKLRRRR